MNYQCTMCGIEPTEENVLSDECEGCGRRFCLECIGKMAEDYDTPRAPYTETYPLEPNHLFVKCKTTEKWLCPECFETT